MNIITLNNWVVMSVEVEEEEDPNREDYYRRLNYKWLDGKHHSINNKTYMRDTDGALVYILLHINYTS